MVHACSSVEDKAYSIQPTLQGPDRLTKTHSNLLVNKVDFAALIR